MASKETGKYILRGRKTEVNYEVTQDCYDSEVDEEFEEDIEDDIDNDIDESLSDVDYPDIGLDNVPVVEADQNNDAAPLKKNIAAKKQVGVFPDGWDDANWIEGDTELNWLPEFSNEGGFRVELPEDGNELDFLSLFLPAEVLDSIVSETNTYAFNYIQNEIGANRLPPHSRFRSWPDTGTTTTRLKAFIALILYFGIIKKDNVKSYWSTDSIYSTPFPRKIMKRDERERHVVIYIIDFCKKIHFNKMNLIK